MIVPAMHGSNREGYEVLRFWNHEVMQNLSSVLDTIARQDLELAP